MAKYKIEIKKSAVKEIKRLPQKDIKRIVGKIGLLADNPRPRGARKISEGEKYRLKCGIYRILYSIEDDLLIVYVVKVGHRKEIYMKR